jgi:hypothetical protein
VGPILDTITISHAIVDAIKANDQPCTPFHPLAQCFHFFFLGSEKRERRKRDFGALESVASPSPLIHGGSSGST